MRYLRLLLLPFSLVYGLVAVVRNWCYDLGVLKSREFDMPVISVGNLDVGGAGKTPMTEYLIRLLKDEHQLATLSRGYGRDTKGYYIATQDSPASEVGDEPAQMKHKFPEVNVTVCEDRVAGAEQLQAANDIIILDDAYQHRAIKPGFSVLLFDHHKLKGANFLLPAGDRREPFSGRRRADVIIVTKCPADMGVNEQGRLLQKVAPYQHQQVFFTSIVYLGSQDRNGENADMVIDANTTVFVLTGIANPAPLYQHLAKFTPNIIAHKYPDHHRFSLKNIAKLAVEFEACKADKKIIITTEKDMQRLGEQELLHLTQQLPLYTLPIGTAFLNNSDGVFDQLIKNYVRKYTAHSSLH